MKKGFTLIELLVTTAILSAIAVVTTNVLFDTVVTRSKQYSIAGSNEEIRNIINEISKSVHEASSVNIVNAQTIEIQANVCKTYKYNSVNKSLELATDSSANCTAPSTGFSQVSSSNLVVSNFSLSPISNQVESVNVNLDGVYKNANGEHNFDYSTSIFLRTSI